MAAELTYPLRTAAEASGLSEHVLRAWEKRHRLVVPARTPGGTRRYSAADVDRLRLAKAAVDAGHRIGNLASLSNDQLRDLTSRGTPFAAGDAIDRVIRALGGFREREAEREIALQISALGPGEFCRSFAAPLLRRIGDEWAAKQLCVASEHLGSSLIRGALTGALRAATEGTSGPCVVLTSLHGESHELGTLMAGIAVAYGGATPLFLGPDLPVREIVVACLTRRARAVALGVVQTAGAQQLRDLRRLRKDLPTKIDIWVGGEGARRLKLPPGVTYVDSISDAEHRARLLAAN